MKFRVTLVLLLAVAAMPAQAKDKADEMGTAEQRAACGPDVRRFCKHVKAEEGPFAYLSCLQSNQEKLRPACVTVITGGAPPK
jgi:hypothetical protein